MLVLPAAQDRLLAAQGQLAVGAGTDAEIVAEAPVVEVVGALPSGARIRGHFVLRVAGAGQQVLAALLHVPGEVVVGNALGRPRGIDGIRLEGELVMRDVRRRQRNGARHVGFRHRQGLAGQGVHQVEIEILEPRLPRQRDRIDRLAAVVDAAQPCQAAVVETLDAEAQPVDAGLPVVPEASVLGGAGVGLECDLGIGREAQARRGAFEEPGDRRGRKQARRTAAEEHAVHRAAPDQRQVLIEIGQQRIHVGIERRRAALEFVRVEIAVRTLSHAPGQVHVQRQRRGQQGVAGHAG